MSTRVFLVHLIMFVSSSLVAAGELIEIRILETKPPNPPAAQPGVGAQQLPRDAKVLASIEASADAAGEFGAKCTAGGETLRLKGRVTAVREGKRRVQVEFSHRHAAGLQEVTTIVTMGEKGQQVISVLTGASGGRLIVLSLQADEEPGKGCDR